MFKKKGLRTNPTIKPLATMNRKNLGKVEIKLGMIQLVSMLGLIIGSMAFAFYIGLFSGQKAGFEQALEESMANAARLPIDAEDMDHEISDEAVSDIYAKLGDRQARPRDGEDERSAPVPALDKIHTTETAPIVVEESEELEEPRVEDDPLLSGLAASGDTKKGDKARVRLLGKVIEEDLEKKVDDHKVVDESSGINIVKEERKEKQESLKVARNNLASKVTLGSVRNSSEERTKENLASVNKKQLVAEKATNIINQPKAIRNKNEKREELRVKKVTVAERKPKQELKVAANTNKPSNNIRTQYQDTAKLSKPEPSRPKTTIEQKKSVSGAEQKQFYSGRGVPKGWFAQVAAPREMSDARSLAGQLKGSGFPVSIERARVRGQEYYRVLVGPENSRQLAQRLIQQLKREPYLTGDPFIKLIR